MTWITDLINNMPQIIEHILYGYIFIFAYRWITYKDKPLSKDIIVESIFINYLLLQILPQNPLTRAAISMTLGFSIGLLLRSDTFNEWLREMNIRRNIREQIWEDIISKGCWLDITTENKRYYGELVNIEHKGRHPQLILTRYTVYDSANREIADYDKDLNQYVLIDTAKTKNIEIIYTESSPKYIA